MVKSADLKVLPGRGLFSFTPLATYEQGLPMRSPVEILSKLQGRGEKRLEVKRVPMPAHIRR